MQADKQDFLIAGPILRHVSPSAFTLWLVTQQAVTTQLLITDHQGQAIVQKDLNKDNCHTVQVGTHCFIHLVELTLDTPLQADQFYFYDLIFDLETEQSLNTLVPALCYPGFDKPRFCLRSHVDNMYHGSCRKPHHHQDDALAILDDKLQASMQNPADYPAMLMMSGDQIYADDVAGPMLHAIHQVMNKLGLFNESWQGTDVNNTEELLSSKQCYYLRESLLPDDKASQAMLDSVFRGARKPIFTSVGAQNHLICLSEIIAMYLLVWSDTPWQWLELDKMPPQLDSKQQDKYQHELSSIDAFASSLPKVRRALAHIPTYMIFDDHDVTDDWNLTRGWEEAAYNNPYSKRIIGNALIAYWLCQGWGNMPKHFKQWADKVPHYFKTDVVTEHDDLVQQMFDWQQWHYVLDTQPKVVVLDTRTHRWRSENSANKPSGLMDWETLSELQQELVGEKAVIMVSPAPVFGVKLIEVIQHIFTFFGKPLMVDAENWMAHPGSANVILNIFHHKQTPPNFIILSGDVHYSFAYDVTLRNKKDSPRVLQVTASGIKNAFPDKLLSWLDRLNRFLFSHSSFLNWFTKRRHMKVKRRQIIEKGHVQKGAVLFNHAGIGEIILADEIDDVVVKVHTSDGREIEFD
ncbi:alkaline phosphatase family protein [Catenovulum sp. SM1970]|uniref:alkaline phosphatase D family protein n=1 Tax=Marinifaba aquimaris TaxID=2741323 RepID=UPI0015739970|nr:alkaline phosphatase D family protein [Marinifaba aquimaris]NTS77240.1 alkaline phosphatase family protein [Marinifaba aquimaris]